MKTSLIKATAAFGFALLALNSYAEQGGMKMDSMKTDSMEAGSSKGTSMAMNEAEVSAVNKANKSITLKHGPIKSKTVEMPPMTMEFQVKNAALLSGVKPGDKVHFTVENVKNQPTVTELKAQK
jgi:Cu(I)/Ag(I) efflux system protein CusF